MTDKPNLIDIRVAKLLAAENPKAVAWDYLAPRVEEIAGPDASYEDYKRAVAKVKQDDAIQFTSPDDGPPIEMLTASQRLEKANAEADLKFKAKNPAPGKLQLTDAERAKLLKMSAEEKNDFANARNAAEAARK